MQKIVNERRASNTKYDDLLDMLLEARYEDGEAMEDEQLIDEILVLFIAGHETTSNALSFICQLLALHPDWQQKVYLETQQDLDEDLMAVVTKSPITQQVIEEGMRLYPPAYFIDRVNIGDDEFNGKFFPAGSNLLFSIYEIHRHPGLWKDPEKFYPERFNVSPASYSSKYFPFGAGPRKCIGNNFAMFEMIIAVQEIVSKFQILPVKDKIEIKPLITLKPKNAFVKFKIRK